MHNCAYCIEALNSCINSEIQVKHFTLVLCIILWQLNFLVILIEFQFFFVWPQSPDYLKKHLSGVCMLLSTNSSEVLKELVIIMKTLTKSSKIELLIGEMNFAVQKLQDSLNSVPNSFIGPTVSTLQAPNEAKREIIPKTTIPSLMDVFPMASLVYLLIQIAARIEGIADAVDQLAGLAEFKLAMDENSKQKKSTNKSTSDNQDHETMKTSPKV